jgi:transcriptional regulator of NAD metabolism
MTDENSLEELAERLEDKAETLEQETGGVIYQVIGDERANEQVRERLYGLSSDIKMASSRLRDAASELRNE